MALSIPLVVRCFTDELDRANHRVLGFFVGQELLLIHTRNIALAAFDRLDRYARKNLRDAGRPDHSYRLRLLQDTLPEFVRKGIRREHIDRDAEQLPQLVTHGADIHQTRIGQGFHQNIEIAAVLVLATQHGAEDPHLGDPMTQGNLPYAIAMSLQGCLWAHGRTLELGTRN